MIKRVVEGEKLPLAKTGVEAQKIRALWLCYGSKYDFCRFYSAEFFTLCELNGSFVVCENDSGKAPRNGDFEELSEFLKFWGYGDIFCSENVGKRLQNALCCDCRTLFLMQFTGTADPCEVEEIEKEPPLSEVFDILKTGFEIDFEPWYLDMSHRARHGVTRFRRLGGAVLAI